MIYTAELRYNPTIWGEDKPICTGTSNGKSPPRYQWADDLDPVHKQACATLLKEHYERGLYGTGSPGEVRDMLHAMDRTSQELDGIAVVRAPEATRKKAQQEADAANAALPEGAVW